MKLGDEFGRDEYLLHPDARFSKYDIYDGGKTFEYYRCEAGYNSKAKLKVSDDEYYDNYKKACIELGREPKTSEYKKYRLGVNKSRREIFRNFKERAISEGILSEEETTKIKPSIEIFDEKPQQEVFPSSRSVPPIPEKTKKWERIGIEGFPYAPQNELGVVAIFAILCSKATIPWQIIELNGGKGIDATCYDDNQHREIKIEIKKILSHSNWNHPFESIDYLVCWENHWDDFPKPLLELKTFIKKS